MPTDTSRSRDSESQQSDKQYKPSSSSRKVFDLSRINAERNYADSVWRGKNTGKREYNSDTERLVTENGKFVQEFKLPGKSGLKGGASNGEGSSRAREVLRIVEDNRMVNIQSLVDKIVENFNVRGGSDIIARSNVAREMTQNKMSQDELENAHQYLSRKDIDERWKGLIYHRLRDDYTQ